MSFRKVRWSQHDEYCQKFDSAVSASVTRITVCSIQKVVVPLNSLVNTMHLNYGVELRITFRWD